MKKQQSLREHVLVPLMLLMINITLGVGVYLLHQLYVVHLSDNAMLLRTYNLSDEQDFTYTNLMWASVFIVLLIAQLLSLRIRHSIIYIPILLMSVVALFLWM